MEYKLTDLDAQLDFLSQLPWDKAQRPPGVTPEQAAAESMMACFRRVMKHRGLWSKSYTPNGKKECARRRRQAHDHVSMDDIGC